MFSMRSRIAQRSIPFGHGIAALLVAIAVVAGGAFLAARTPSEAKASSEAQALSCPTPPKSISDFLKKIDLWLGCEWPRGEQADEAIKLVRLDLRLRRSSFSSPQARLWLDRTVEKLDLALQRSRWGPGDVVKNDQSGYEALRALRIAMGRLYWVNPTLRTATGPERTGIAAALWYISAGRFNKVWKAGGSETKLASAEEAIFRGNDDFIAGGISTSGGVRIRSTLRYITAWQTLLGQPPA